MKSFISVVIKPTLSCNIDCRHCYHTPDQRVGGTISFDVLERIFKLISSEYEAAWFIWHGGEPLTLSLDFYEKMMELQRRYFDGSVIRSGNTIQTNGTLLDKKFINFCKDNAINIGISHEGPYNDVLREGTKQSSKNIEYLNNKDRLFSVSSTISAETANKQEEIYQHFVPNGIAVSFSPVIPSGCSRVHREFVPNADEYIESGIKAFEKWLYDTSAEVPLLPYYLYVLKAVGQPTQSDCAHESCLTKWLCFYPNGDVYPCAKSCPEEFRLCNISEIESIDDVFRTEGFRNILLGSVARREKCSTCDIYGYCNGGCSVDAYYENGIEENGGDSCKIFKALFTHVLDTVNGILEDEPDLSIYNKFVRDAILGKLVNPMILM